VILAAAGMFAFVVHCPYAPVTRRAMIAKRIFKLDRDYEGVGVAGEVGGTGGGGGCFGNNTCNSPPKKTSVEDILPLASSIEF